MVSVLEALLVFDTQSMGTYEPFFKLKVARNRQPKAKLQGSHNGCTKCDRYKDENGMDTLKAYWAPMVDIIPY